MNDSKFQFIGWREWVALPALSLPAIKVKVDTGARTSAIHAFDIQREDDQWVSFSVQPLQRNDTLVRRCRAPIVDIRKITDSGGHIEERFVIGTELVIGPITKPIELTLTERRSMLFRMLLGRTALIPEFRVDPALSYTFGRLAARRLYTSVQQDP